MLFNANPLPNSDERKNEKSTVEIREMRTSDAKFRANYNVKVQELVRIDLETLFDTLPTPENIVQHNIGNCYFLAALANVMRRDPDFISKIMRVTPDGKVAVSFYDANDVTKRYVYIIDPTKVVKAQASNPHKHEAIFLLEKAYAIHRLTLEPTKYTTLQIKVRKAMLQCGGVAANQADVLNLLAEDISDYIKKQNEKLDAILTLRPEEIESSNDTDIILVRKVLQKYNYDRHQAREILAAENEYHCKYIYKSAIGVLKEKMLNEKKDYLSALTEGYPDDVFRSLIGMKTHRLPIYHEDLRYFLESFFLELRTQSPEKCHEHIQSTLIQMFGSLDDNKTELLSQAIKTMSNDRWEAFQHHTTTLLDQLNQKIPIETRNQLLMIFTNYPHWSVGSDAMIDSTMAHIQSYLEQNTLSKRGTGRYTNYQRELYEQIKKALKEGCYIVVSTKSTGVGTKKGLLFDHSYEVLNCYMKGGLCYVHLRNPWSQFTREYVPKVKVIHHDEQIVLSAVEGSDQLSKKMFKTFLAKIGSVKEPVIEDPALPGQPILDGNGCFSLELSDVTKNVDAFYISEPQRDLSHRNERTR